MTPASPGSSRARAATLIFGLLALLAAAVIPCDLYR